MKPGEWVPLSLSKSWRLVAWVVLVGISLRWVGLDAQSLWFDEAVTLKYASLPKLFPGLLELASIGRGSERLQLLNVILAHFWIGLFGNSVVALHALPALLGVLSMGGAWLAGRNLAGPKCGFWAVTCTAFAGYSVYYSQEFRPYALLLFTGILKMACYITVVRSSLERGENVRGRWVLALCCLLGFATSVFSGIFTVILFAAHTVLLRDAKVLFRAWWPTVLCCLPVGLFYGWLVFFMTAANLGNSIPVLRQDSILNVIYGIYGVVMGLTYAASQEELRREGIGAVQRYAIWYVPVVLSVIVLFVANLRSLIKHWKDKPREIEPIKAMVLAGIGMFFFQAAFAVWVDFNLLPRHQFWLFPLVTLMFAWIMSQGGRVVRIAGVALLALNLVSSVLLHTDSRYAKDDFRSAAQFLKEETTGNRVVVSAADWLFAYYGLEGVVSLRQWDGLNKKQCFQEMAAAGPVWLVLNRPFDTIYPDGGILGQSLAPELSVKRVIVFKYMKLYEIVSRSP